MIDIVKTEVNDFRITKGEMASDDSSGNSGAFRIPLGQRTVAFAIVDGGIETGWEHVSVHIKYKNKKGKITERTPSWDEMCKIKGMFWNQEDAVIQFHPPQSEYVNNHKHCLHLWKHQTDAFPMPPACLVGVK